MRFFADLHVHSHFSRATSAAMVLPEIAACATAKGVSLVGSGDALHPGWLAELRGQLREAGDGVYALKSLKGECGARFVVAGEVSCIFADAGRTRRVHLVALFPSVEVAAGFSASLADSFNLSCDGRPILKMHAREFLARLLDRAPGAAVIPAHVWTPWYSLLGERTGYSSVEECFGDLSPHIPALETGLSADPAMARRVSALDGYGLVSFSDAHSPKAIGREACEFTMDEISFPAVVAALRPGDPRFLSTVEFHPAEGKYYLGGHRKCGVGMDGAEAAKVGGLCPVCGKRMTGGVEWRIGELADRAEGVPDRPFCSLLPLIEVIAQSLGCYPSSARGVALAERLVDEVGPEIYILRDASIADVAAVAGERVAEGLARAREGNYEVTPGFDGRFGRVSLFPHN